jgi:hypothetical protein
MTLRGGLRDLGWIEARFIFEIVHCGHARQNRRPIPLRTRVAGSGVSGRCALSRVSRAQNDECAYGPKRLIAGRSPLRLATFSLPTHREVVAAAFRISALVPPN